MAYENGVWIPEKGLVPLDLAVELAGLKQSDLYEWVPGNTVCTVPTTSPVAPLGVMFAIKSPEGLRVIEIPHPADKVSPEEIAEAIKAELAQARRPEETWQHN